MSLLRRSLLLFLGALLTASTALAASFTPGNLVLVRVGTGTGALINTGNPVFLDEYTTSGTFVQSVPLPTSASGPNQAFFLSGTATSEGLLSRSTDGNFLVLAGYGGSGVNLPASTASTVNRVIARVTANGSVDTTTALTDFASGGNPRSAATVDGSAFWVAGSSNGERFATLGATTSTSISTTVNNLRVTQIFNNQLYVSDASGTAVRLGTIGTGVPTTSGQVLVTLPGLPTSTGSPYGYFFADLTPAVGGLDTLYVADDGGQILKYSLVGGTWTANGSIAAAAVRGLAGSVSGSTVSLYGVTGASGGAGSSKLYRFIDSTGYNGAISGTATTLFTDVANTAFRGIAFAPAAGGGGGGPIAPTVTTTTPADNAINVSPGTSITVTFNAAVNVTGTWFTINGSISGSHTATVLPAASTFTLVPSPAFAEGETVTVNILGAQVTDAITGTAPMAANYPFAFTTQTYAPLPIHTIQGSGTTSPFVGQAVAVEGIVTADFQGSPGLGGFYLQSTAAGYDADPATSEGIFVFNTTFPANVGDFVRVSGTVAEFGTAPSTQTELTGVTSVILLTTGNALPAPVSVTLPFASTTSAEAYEGMLVTLPQTLTVTDNFDLGHFGEIFLSNGRLSTPTNIVAPGAPAIAQDVANFLNKIMVDDGISTAYPNPTPFLADSAGRGATRRAGSTATGVTGILDEKFGSYLIEPTAPLAFVDANPRSDPPAPGGSLKIAIGNVLNFYNGNGSGLEGAAGGFPTSRGADSLAEFQRQRAKIIAGITALAPDIMGLTEVENDRVTNGLAHSYGPTSAIADLVNGLNAVAPAGTTYAFVDASAVDIVSDEIHCAFIYRVETAVPVGAPAMLDHPAFNGYARNPLAQTFRQLSTGGKLTVSINHFKSKGSASTGAAATGGIVPNPNLDQGDGQGQSNYVRTLQAQALTAWLATDPTGSGDPDFLIIGDLNAYAKENPITAIEGAGFINLTEASEGAGGYSYAFDSAFGHLDHALANGHLAGQVASAATWHVNADEPVYYDYNVENKVAAQQAVNVGGPYRYSDHDPVVVGLNLSPDPATDVTSKLQITRSNWQYVSAIKRFRQTVTVKNLGTQALGTPLSLVLTQLSPSAKVYLPAGFTTVVTPLNSPYVNVSVGTDNVLTPGESASVEIEFVPTTSLPPTYGLKAVAGPGAR